MSQTPPDIIDATLRDCGCCTTYDDVRTMILQRLEAADYRIVGPEATEAMIMAADRVDDSDATQGLGCRGIFRVMLKAAPRWGGG